MMKSKWWLVSLLVCLAVAGLSPLASSAPDGLERVAQDQGFGGLAKAPPLRLIADYLFPGIENGTTATILAGMLGTLLLFSMAYALAWLLAFRKRQAGGVNR